MIRDPRILQIFSLGVLLASGAWFRDFSIRPEQIALTFAAGLAAQWLGDRLRHAPNPSLRSAVITSFSLSLLLRADNLWAHPLAAAMAIGGKFVLRHQGKHLFNPGNLGVILALLLVPGTWVSPGQWGDDLALAAWFVALGGVVVVRARRSDVSLVFLAAYLGALGLRVAWLGQAAAVWLHQLQSGALLLFAFFMISDPMTIPNHVRGRAAHAVLVAAIAYHWQFSLYRPNALVWALFIAAPAVPLWDALWPAAKYEWNREGDPRGKDARDPSHVVGELAGRGALVVRPAA
ncbi:MAG: RnfABCDGE type electron transport complex subunit D [Candidatus Binatia bacterium]